MGSWPSIMAPHFVRRVDSHHMRRPLLFLGAFRSQRTRDRRSTCLELVTNLWPRKATNSLTARYWHALRCITSHYLAKDLAAAPVGIQVHVDAATPSPTQIAAHFFCLRLQSVIACAFSTTLPVSAGAIPHAPPLVLIVIISSAKANWSVRGGRHDNPSCAWGTGPLSETDSGSHYNFGS